MWPGHMPSSLLPNSGPVLSLRTNLCLWPILTHLTRDTCKILLFIFDSLTVYTLRRAGKFIIIIIIEKTAVFSLLK